MHSLFVMPSHYNCCVPLCTNHSRRNSKLSFYRIPKDKSLHKEYTRLIRNETLKLESSHTRICSAHFEGGEKKYRRQLPSIFPWSKPCKVRKPPTRRRLDLNNVLSTSNLGDLGPCVESEVEVGAQRLLSLRHWSLTTFHSMKTIVPSAKKLKQTRVGTQRRIWRSNLNISKKK